MADQPSRGPEVPGHEDLLRTIVRPEWWDPDEQHLSSGIFGFPKFSAYIASMTSEDAVLGRFPAGCGMVQFNCGTARDLGFDARHEPEQGEQSHANIYCGHTGNKRKKQARALVEAATVTRLPDLEKLRAAVTD
jgi:hypothetical protein